jgi:allantoicase
MSELTEFVDLAAERLGGKAIAANDEFFAPKENLLKAAPPVFLEHKYTDRGKWMDGWETRRRRTPGNDWCIVRLGLPGVVRGVEVDTRFFRGNFPEFCSIEACDLGGAPPYAKEQQRLKAPGTRWVALLPQTALEGDKRNVFSIAHEGRFTHLRLRIYPDGGVARLRVLGEVVPDKKLAARAEIDLAAVQNGGRAIAASDRFFSEPGNLLMPGSGRDMGDGWETRRRRGPGHDWVIIKLGLPGMVRRIEVDTAHFKGNFPDSCSAETCYAAERVAPETLASSGHWRPLLAQSKLKADARQVFAKNLKEAGWATHVRFNIYPDGGVSRLRLFGRPERLEDRLKGIELFNQIPRARAARELLDCCGSKAWAEQMLARRPYADADKFLAAADEIWRGLGRKDWLEAFRHHPPIGGAKAAGKQSAKAKGWSAREQAAAQKSSSESRAVLAAGNQAYRTAFGYVFLICATGKSSEEILKELQQRLSNEPEAELRVAAEEQRKITRLRLERLLAS